MMELASLLPAGSLLVFPNQKSRRLKEGTPVLLPAPINIIPATGSSSSHHQLVPSAISLSVPEVDTSPRERGCLILRIRSPDSVGRPPPSACGTSSDGAYSFLEL